jgi:hypothetical protein
VVLVLLLIVETCETEVWSLDGTAHCADKQVRWLFSRKFDWVVQVIPQHAIKAILVLSTTSTTRKNSDRAAKAGMPLFTFTTALGLYGGVLCSGELRGPIIRDVTPTYVLAAARRRRRRGST